MEQWSKTRDLKLAAALGTLGMPLRIGLMLDEKSGVETCRFSIGLGNLEGTYKTVDLRGGLNSGRLEAKHPLLNILRTFRNREFILDCTNKGAKIRLVQVPGTKVWEYVESDSGLPGVKPGDFVFKTANLKFVAALGLLGLPLLLIEGPEGNRTYYVRSIGEELGAGLGRADAVALTKEWRRDKAAIPWEHPFAQGMRGLYNRERLLDAVRICERKIILRPTRGIKSAIISEQARRKAWDEVTNFFNR